MTMRLSNAVIDAAFECHAKYYGDERFWTVRYHVECWKKARDAFDAGSETSFNWLYDELRKKWQVFRSQKYDAPPSKRVLQILNTIPADLRHRRLNYVAEPIPVLLDELWNALTTVAEIKRNKDGPSLVAISKFLHFWNP